MINLPTILEKAIPEKVGHYYDVSKDLKVFRMSSVGDCSAALTFDFTVKKKEPFDKNLVRLYMGTLWHDVIEKWFELTGLLKVVNKEQEVSLQLGSIKILGHYDYLLLYGSKQQFVVDIKTCNDNQYNNYMQNLSRMYAWQIACYSKALGVPGIVLLLNIEKGMMGQMMLDSPVDEVIEDVKNHLKAVVRARVDESGDVNREYEMNKPPCTWCRHRFVCWGAERTTSQDVLTIANIQKAKPVTAKKLRQIRVFWKEYELNVSAAESSKARAKAIASDLLSKKNKRAVVCRGFVEVRKWGKDIRISV